MRPSAAPRERRRRRGHLVRGFLLPPNVARTLASLAAYVATRDDDGLQVHQYASAEIRTGLSDGRLLALDIDTAYPREGEVVIRFREDSGGPATLSLRIPSQARGARARVVPASGETEDLPTEPGIVAVRRDWRAADVVELHLPLEPRLTAADPRIDAIRGCLAVERGPEVFCLESADLVDVPGAGGDVGNVRLDSTVPPRDSEGRTVVTLLVTRPHWPHGR